MIEDDEAFNAKAFDEHVAEAGEARVSLGVAGNKTAENDTAVKIHSLENGLHDFTADIFEIDVDTTGSGGDELRFPVGMLVVDGGVEAEIVLNPFAFFIGAGDANDAAAVNFAELSGDTAGGAGGSGNDKGFAGEGLGKVEECKISG